MRNWDLNGVTFGHIIYNTPKNIYLTIRWGYFFFLLYFHIQVYSWAVYCVDVKMCGNGDGLWCDVGIFNVIYAGVVEMEIYVCGFGWYPCGVWLLETLCSLWWLSVLKAFVAWVMELLCSAIKTICSACTYINGITIHNVLMHHSLEQTLITY